MYYKNVANFFLKKIFFDYADFPMDVCAYKKEQEVLRDNTPRLGS